MKDKKALFYCIRHKIDYYGAICPECKGERQFLTGCRNIFFVLLLIAVIIYAAMT